MNYVELQCCSNYSFLRGASHPEELIARAAELGYPALAIGDRNSLAGMVSAHSAAQKHHIKLIVSCQIDLFDGPSLWAYPLCKNGYANLSALLSLGNSRTEKGKCELYQEDVWKHQNDILFIINAPHELDVNFEFEPQFKQQLGTYKSKLGKNLYLALNRTYTGNDQKRLYRIGQLSQDLVLPLVVCNEVYYHCASRRKLQDILTCVREKCTLQNAGYRLHQNAERHLKTPAEMQRLFQQYPNALHNTINISNLCNFSLDELNYQYPEELCPEGSSPQAELERLCLEGAKAKFGLPIPDKVQKMLDYELAFVARKNYASYFLTVHDYVDFARKRNILCQGRGSAANSVICFCLGITSVDPTRFRLLFARFMSDARNEPPDIDVDFEHERREEVIQYIYQKYGRSRAAIVATVSRLHARGAVRDVGKAMGLSLDTIQVLAACAGHRYEGNFDLERLQSQGINIADPWIQQTLALATELVGFPRQLGQHTGGFIICQDKLSDLCPTLNARMENRTCIEWDKNDIEALGFLKVDVLALGMLTCIRKAFTLIETHYKRKLSLDNIPQEDPLVYEMISRADTLGVFQIESRAQMSMLPRLRPQTFYDLVIQVAIVRPGPVQGDMVHPYLRRRNGLEPVDYPSEELRVILEKTYGVPLFQEQAMEIAMVAANFSAAEADELRRSMATFKAKGKVAQFEKKLIAGMVSRGYSEAFAQRIFKQLEGFGSYGFPESHAASFALLVYVSSWLKYHYPDVFAAALLNSMPMGFYQPAQIVSDAQKHNVRILPIDINHSQWDNSLSGEADKYFAIRLGFRNIKGIVKSEMDLLIQHRSEGYQQLCDLRDYGVSQSILELLAHADAYQSMGMSSREALWQISALHDRPIALFKGKVPDNSSKETQIALPLMSKPAQVFQDYAYTGLSIKAHPLSFLRAQLALLHICENKQANSLNNGEVTKVAGLILVRQRPGTAGGICFITLEDETGIINLVVYKNHYQTFRKEILTSKLLMVEGKIQREGDVVHLIVQRCFNYDGLFRLLGKEQKASIFYEGRNFK
jgi:error-prone DNA polymerase